MASQGSRLAILAALAANSIIAVAKFTAAVFTGSAAMLAEGLHSVADSGNQGMLLWGISAARRRGGDLHPFGRGKEIYFWSLMVAFTLFAGGSVFSIQHGINALRHQHAVENFAVSAAVLGGAIVFESFSYLVAIREFNRVRRGKPVWRALRETKDAALLVILLEDTAALGGLVVALGGVIAARITGDPFWDALASILIGVLLAVVAFLMAYETKGLLIGESASLRDQDAIRAEVLGNPNVAEVTQLLTMHMGPEEILVNLEVELAGGLSGDEIHRTVTLIEESIRSALPGTKNIFIETKAGV